MGDDVINDSPETEASLRFSASLTDSLFFAAHSLSRTCPHSRLCLARNMEFSTVVLRNFGAFVPGLGGGGGGDNGGGGGGSGGGNHVKSMREGCGQMFCSKRCLGTADIYWPQVSEWEFGNSHAKLRLDLLSSHVVQTVYAPNSLW